MWHVLNVMCHVSRVTYHMSLIFILNTGHMPMLRLAKCFLDLLGIIVENIDHKS